MQLLAARFVCKASSGLCHRHPHLTTVEVLDLTVVSASSRAGFCQFPGLEWCAFRLENKRFLTRNQIRSVPLQSGQPTSQPNRAEAHVP